MTVSNLNPVVPAIQVFGNLALNPAEDIERHNNFRTFLAALMLLFRYEGSHSDLLRI